MYHCKLFFVKNIATISMFSCIVDLSMWGDLELNLPAVWKGYERSD